MSIGPEFRPDLYRGTARYYDEFRLAYPPSLLDDLRVHARTTGTGRLLDLACGTGQITFGLAPHFAETWAVDQEPEAIAFARAKALERGVHSVRWIAGRAEDVDADGAFELVTIGNAFHRLQRRAIADAAMRWLVPRGHLALLWSYPPWHGSKAWQPVLADILRDWTLRAEATERVPENLDQHLAEEPHATVLTDAGLTIVHEAEFTVSHDWTVETLTGFMFSTSVLSRPALGRSVHAFERDVRDRLLAVQPDGVLHEDVGVAYTLARRP